MILGYEVPNPYPSVFVVQGIISLVPAIGLCCAHHYLAATVAFAIGGGFFHVRNLVVRGENKYGVNQPA